MKNSFHALVGGSNDGAHPREGGGERVISEGQFGFTRDIDAVPAVRRWIAAAIEDGWSVRPTYDREPQECAATLEREGFKVMTVARELNANAKYTGEASIHAWGPDGLAVRVSQSYDDQTFTALQAGLRHCKNCGRDDVATQRYSFAGRCCADCLPAMRAEHEKPGWYN